MPNSYKRQDHPKLVPPLKVRIMKDGTDEHGQPTQYLSQDTEVKNNDEGKVVDGRVYAYHPTKGWRSRRLGVI